MIQKRTYTNYSTLPSLTQQANEANPLSATISVTHGEAVPNRYTVFVSGGQSFSLEREGVRRFAEALIELDDELNRLP